MTGHTTGVAKGSTGPIGVRLLRGDWLVPATVLLTAGIGAVDFLTGYEVRLAGLYLVPIALVTWFRGRAAGLALSAAACGFWLASFSAVHSYSRPALFYWDAAVMATTFFVFAMLLSRLHRALASADERFARLLKELEAAVYVVDPASGRLLYANPRMAQMLGAATPRDLEGQLRGRFGATPSPGSPAGVASGFASDERRDSATGRWYLIQSGPIPWRNGEMVSLNVVTDVSDRHQAAQLRRENEDILRRTARLTTLSETTSALAHEINQPLMAIASYTDAGLRLLAKEGGPQGELAIALERCRAQAVRAGRILSRMRDFVRSRRPQPQPCDLGSVVKEALELTEARIRDHGIAVDLELADDLPPIFADRFLLVQVVVNLLDNALEALNAVSPERRRMAVATFRDRDGRSGVAVADQGPGIAPEMAAKLYEPFVSGKSQGLGLGLSICRSVVEAHGGRLWHEPNAGGGAVFRFTIGRDDA